MSLKEYKRSKKIVRNETIMTELLLHGYVIISFPGVGL